MRSSSSITCLHSAVESSRGSRRPELDRQCTHARLHAYVSSQVRQIGASSPRANSSLSPACACDRRRTKLSRRVSKSYARAPKRSGRKAVSSLSRAARRRRSTSAALVDTTHAVDRHVLHEQVLLDDLFRLDLFDLGLDHRIRHGCFPSTSWSQSRNVPSSPPTSA